MPIDKLHCIKSLRISHRTQKSCRRQLQKLRDEGAEWVKHKILENLEAVLEAVLEVGCAADRVPGLESQGLRSSLSHHYVVSVVILTSLSLFPHVKRY